MQILYVSMPQIENLRALCCWLQLCSYGSLKIRLASSINHPSAFCVVIAPYILPPYYTDGAITAGPIAVARQDHMGPICGMKHQTQLHLCVFLIYPSFPASLILNPLPPFSPPPTLPSSATRQIKSLSIMTQMREAHL